MTREQELSLACYTGNVIPYNAMTYDEDRRMLHDLAGKWIDQGQTIHGIIALDQVKRLDKVHAVAIGVQL